ncbi:hypothetical protein LMG33818_000479 [Halomonadaceae bacterium LMG 33818]|uniref:MFS transporter n=1 Tax=Cernens ardua TaxID=3402176 RepID=UPI003EDBAD4A
MALSALYINKPFTWLWIGQVLSTLGEFSMISAISVWVTVTLFHGSPDLPLAVGLILGIPRIPSILLSTSIGTWVDHHSPKKCMLGADGARACLYLLLFFALGEKWASPWTSLCVVITLMTIGELFSLFFTPARAIVMQQVTPREKRIQAASLSTFSSQGVALITSFLGPVMYGLFGIRYAVMVNMISFVLSFLCIANTGQLTVEHKASDKRQSMWKEMEFALLFIFHHPSLRVIFLGSLCYAISQGVDSPLISQFPLTTLHLSPEAYGELSFCFPLGGVLIMLVNTRILHRWGSLRVFVGSLIVLGGIKLAFALSNAVDVYLYMMLMGAVFTLVLTSLGPELQNTIPNQHMGKISPIFSQANAIISTFYLFFSSALLAQINHWIPTATDNKYRIALVCSACLLVLGGVLVYGLHKRLAKSEILMANTDHDA